MRVFLLCVIVVAFCEPMFAAKKSDYDLENWMGQLSTLLENKKINEIVMPGTHNSGSYPISLGSRITDRSELADILDQDSVDAWMMEVVRQAGPGWSKCQQYSILDQLKMGNRYLDLRVYCDKQTDEYYLEHFFIGSNFTDELLQIADFVKSHEEELLILDIKSVQNCSNHYVTQLLERMEQLFNNKLAEPPIQDSESLPTYGKLVANGTTVIVAMRNFEYKERFDWLWDRRTHIDDPYADTANVKYLKTYITATMSQPRTPRSLYVSQMILTPTTEEYVAGITRSGPVNLQELTAPLNKKFLRWLGDFRLLQPNIFSLDFSSEHLSRRVISFNFEKKKESKKKGKPKTGANNLRKVKDN